GDDAPESVALVGRFVVVYGRAYRGGEGYDFLALPVERSGDVLALDLRDLTGNGKAELIVEYRQRNAAGTREIWRVFRFSGESVDPLFAIEKAKESGDGRVESQLRVIPGRPPRIEVRARPSRADPADFREAGASDAVPILVPWGPVASRTYQWDGRTFAVQRERANRSYRAPAPEAPHVAGAAATEQTRPAAAPTLRDMMRAARDAAGLRGRPTFTEDANLAGGPELERAAIFGSTLIAVGPGIRGGQGYVQVALAPEGRSVEVRRFRATDLTGDGRAELLLEVREGGEFERDVLVVQRFVAGGSFSRALQRTIGVRQGQLRLRNEVRTRGGRLVIAPGEARGWNGSSWPFARDAAGPLLPWSDRATTFTLQRGQLVPSNR
ncbi:MAG: hypothetical protein AAF411_29340, partial [Myxococcota bacterium]